MLVPVLLVALEASIFAAVASGGKTAVQGTAGTAPRETAVTQGGEWLTSPATRLLSA